MRTVKCLLLHFMKIYFCFSQLLEITQKEIDTGEILKEVNHLTLTECYLKCWNLSQCYRAAYIIANDGSHLVTCLLLQQKPIITKYTVRVNILVSVEENTVFGCSQLIHDLDGSHIRHSLEVCKVIQTSNIGSVYFVNPRS